MADEFILDEYLIKLEYEYNNGAYNIDSPLYVRIYDSDSIFICGCWVESLSTFGKDYLPQNIIEKLAEKINKIKAFI